MHTSAPCVFFALVVICLTVVGLATVTAAESIVAASFTNSSCSVLKTNPQTLNSGECMFTSDYGFYYTIFEHPNNTAQYLYGCLQGCAPANCTIKGSGPFGSCQQIHVTPDTSVYASAVRVLNNATLGVTVYDDDQCTSPVPNTGETKVVSGSCTYVKQFYQTIMASYVDGRDEPASKRVAVRAQCNQDCSNCKIYGNTAIGQCSPNRGYWLKVELTKVDSGSDGMPTWELAVIIACSAGGGVFVGLVLFAIIFFVCRSARSKRRSYESINTHP